MTLQFAVLASGSRGNSTLVRGRRARAADRRRASGRGRSASGSRASARTGRGRRGRLDPHPRRSRRHRRPCEMARRRIAFHCHEGHRDVLAADPGFQRLEEAGLVRLLRRSSVPDRRPASARADPAAARRRPDVRVPDRGLGADGGPAGQHRLPRRHRELVRARWPRAWPTSTCSASSSTTTWRCRSPRAGRRRLIERNLGDRGHLSNRQGAELVAAVLSRSRTGASRHLVLLHLSEQCNQPELAIEAARDGRPGRGASRPVHAARQAPAHPNLWISPASHRAVSAAAASTGRTVAATRPRGRSRCSRVSIAGLFDDSIGTPRQRGSS